MVAAMFACPTEAIVTADSLAQYGNEEQATIEKHSDEARIGADQSEDEDGVAILLP